MRLEPSRSLYTKAWMVLGTITLALLVAVSIATLIVSLAADDSGNAIPVLWIVAASIVVALWVIAYPIAWLWIRNLSYEVSDDAVVIHKGILTKVDQEIPLRMVTDFRLHRSLYDRLLHIGSIDIQTAGQHQTATGYEGRISGQYEPEHLHDELRRRIRKLARTRAGNGDAGVNDLHALLEEVREIHHLLER